MFEKALSEKLKKIFSMKKVSFDLPGEAVEQDTLFIEITNSRCRIKDARQIARATGKISLFAQHEKVPFGLFTKAIAAADAGDVNGFFFYELDENASRYRNLVERSASFVFFYSGQYDPEQGEIEELNLQEQVDE